MIENKKRKLTIWLILLVINLVIIWGNSLLPGHISGAISNGLKDFIVKLFAIKPGEGPGGGGLIRKAAHFTEFTCLGVCLSQLFRMGGKKKIAALGFPLLWGSAAAAIDETIQRFVPDRGPNIYDVALDTAGVITGIVIVTLIYYFRSKKQTVLEEEK